MSHDTTGMLSILSSTYDIEDMVSDWLSSYEVNKKKAILNLVQMLIGLSGSSETISENNLEETANWMEIIQNMSEKIELDKQPLIEVRRNRVRLAVFFQLMFRNSEHLNCDDYFLKPLLRIIVCMSLQNMRVFRLTGTLSALKITTGLVNVHVVIRNNLFLIQKQLSSEESKESPRKSSFRIESLENQRNEYEKNENYLRDIIQYCVNDIFKKRVRDVMPEIVVLCINEMSVWMMINPELFLNDNLFIYFRLCLPHSSVGVRKACLESLNLLYDKNKYRVLKKLVKYIMDLLMDMIFDTSKEVSVFTINLFTKIVTDFGVEIFKQRHEEIFLLIYSRHGAIGDAAGEFLLAWIKATISETQGRLENHVALLVSLATFVVKSKLPRHSVLLVDSLFVHCDALKDWESMNDALLDDSRERPLESSLLQLVATAVHMACTGQSPRPDRKKGKVSRKQLDRQRKHSEEVTRYLAASLPRLLLRHRCDADNVWNLLDIAKHFRVEKISTNNDSYVRHLIKKLKDLIEIHKDERVLNGCCEVVDKFLSRNEANISTYSIFWESVFDDMISNTKCHLENLYKIFEEGQKPHTDSLCTLNNNLQKLVLINVSHPLKLEPLWNVMYQLLNKCTKISVVPKVIIMNCIKICHLILLEEASTIHRENKESEGKTQSQGNKLLTFFDTLSLFLKNEVSKVQRFTFVVFCDLLIVYFSKHDGHPSLHTIDITSNIFLDIKKYIETLLRTTRESTSKDVVQFKKEALKLFATAIRNRALHLDAGACIFNYFEDRNEDVREIMRQNIEDMVKIDGIQSVENVMKVVSVKFQSLLKNEIRDDPSGIKENISYWIKLFYHPLRNHPPALHYFHSLCLRLATELMEKKQPHLPLLEVLAAFVQGLSSRERSSLLSALEESFPHRPRSVAVYKAALTRRAALAPGTVRRGDKVRISPRATDSEISSAESSKKRRGLRSPLRSEEDSSKKSSKKRMRLRSEDSRQSLTAPQTSSGSL